MANDALNSCGVCLRGADTGENGQEQEEEDHFWIGCDACDQWYHGICTNVQEYESVLLKEYHCPKCVQKHGQSIPRKHVNHSRYEFDDLNSKDKAVQIGTKDFIDSFKTKLLSNFEDAGRDIVDYLSSGKDLTVDSLINSGWKKPILVLKSEGLGLSIPDDISVEKVMHIVGASTFVDIIDVYLQRSYKMMLSRFYDIWKMPSSKRNRLYNIISLEFSNSDLCSVVRLPLVVRELSWAHHIWPCIHNPVEELGVRKWNLDKTELLLDHDNLKPEVSMFCLVGMQDSFTDFHIDFGGSSVWYHVFYGEKVFLVAQPSSRNMSVYESWFANPKRSEIFLPDLLPPNTFKIVRVKPGNTFLIPSGWIHAVWTPVDTLVFGGNFLSYLHTSIQLQIHQMESYLKTEERYMFPSFEVVNWYAAKHMVELLRESNEDSHVTDSYMFYGGEKLICALNSWIKRDKADKAKKPIVLNYQKTVRDLEKVIRIQKRLKIAESKPSPAKSKSRAKTKVPIIRCKNLPPPIPPLRIEMKSEVKKQPEITEEKIVVKRKLPELKIKKPAKTPKLRLKLSVNDTMVIPLPVPESQSEDSTPVHISIEDLSPSKDNEPQVPLSEPEKVEQVKSTETESESEDTDAKPVWGFSMLDLRRNEEIKGEKPSSPAFEKKERKETKNNTNNQVNTEERAPSPDFSSMFGVSSHGRVQKPNALLCGNDDNYLYTPNVESGKATVDEKKYAVYKEPHSVKAADFTEIPRVVEKFDFDMEKPAKNSIYVVKKNLKSTKPEVTSKPTGGRKGQATVKQRLAAKLGIRKYR